MAAAKEKNLTEVNLETNIKLVQAKFDKYVAKCAKMGIGLNAKYLEYRLDLMSINLSIKLKQKADKAKMREEARRLKEQEQLLADAEKERLRLQKERRMYEQNLANCKIGIDEPKALGLDTSMVVVERVPLIISQRTGSIRRIARIEE